MASGIMETNISLRGIELPGISVENLGSATFLPDARKIAVAVTLEGRPSGRAWLFDVETGRREMEFVEDLTWAQTAQISPDGRHVLTCSKGAQIEGLNSVPKIFDITTGECVRRLEGLTGSARCASYSSDGLLVLVASEHGRRW